MHLLLVIVLLNCITVFASSSIVVEDEVAELRQETSKKCLQQLPQKTLLPAENNIKGEYFEMISYNPKLTLHVIAYFGHEVAYNFEFNRYAWIVRTSKGCGVLMLNKDNNGAFMMSLHGEPHHCDAIEQSLFKKFSHSRWSSTAVPDSNFAKEIEASQFVLQTHAKADATGEKPYLRLSNEELEEQQVVSFANRHNQTVRATFAELCNGKKTMHKSATMASLALGHRGTLTLLDSLDEEY